MTTYTFPASPAWDPKTQKAVFGATFYAYATTDTGFTAPLSITDLNGNGLSGLTSGSTGVFPGFQATEVDVVLRDTTGANVWTLTALEGRQGPTGAQGVQGPQGIPGDVSTWKPNTAYSAGQPVVNPSGDLVTAVAAHTSGATYTAANWSNGTVHAFIVENYGAKGDGVTDDTAAVQETIQAACAAGGGTVLFGSHTYLITGQITLPNDGATVPKQVPVRLLGAGSRWDGQWQQSGQVTGGTVLDLRFTTATANQAKIQSFGLGLLVIENLTLTQAGAATDTTPFVYTTNTTLMARDVAVWGYSTLTGTACVQDAFMLGGTTTNIDGTPTGAFQGYGTVIERCYFARIRRGVYGRSWVNNIQVLNSTWAASCGSDNTAAALQFDGSLASGSFAIGNRLAGNVVEITHYPYGFRFTQSKSNICSGNGFWDNSADTISPYLFEGPSSNSGGHVIDDFYPNTSPGSEVTANGLGYSMRKGSHQLGTVLAGGNDGNLVQPQAATASENASLFTVKRSQSEATNSDATVFQMWQDGEFWAGSTWSTNATLHVKNGSSHWWANAASSRVDSGDYQLLAGSDQPYRTVYVSRGLFRLPQLATASRPAASSAGPGSCYYDTTLGKPVFSDGTNWKDAAGTVV